MSLNTPKSNFCQNYVKVDVKVNIKIERKKFGPLNPMCACPHNVSPVSTFHWINARPLGRSHVRDSQSGASPTRSQAGWAGTSALAGWPTTGCLAASLLRLNEIFLFNERSYVS